MIGNIIMQTAGHGLMGQEENSALDSTQTTVPCVVFESVKLSSHCVLPSAQISGTEAPHLLALWARRKAARAGPRQGIHKNKTQDPCEYIHCTCSLCSPFWDVQGNWQVGQYTVRVGCKCSQCRVCFDRTGHWDTEREGLNHARSLGHTMTPISVSSRLLGTMSSDTPLDTHLEGPDCHTQVWLSSQQIEQERRRVRRALNTRYAEGTRGNYTW